MNSGNNNSKYLKVAVIGAGSVGLATAAHLAALGHHIRLWNRGESRISEIANRGTITSCGCIDGEFQMNLVTDDFDEAISGAEWVFVCVPASAHRDIAARLAVSDHCVRLVVLVPGRCLGSLDFENSYLGAGGKRTFMLAETQTVPHTCRTLSQGNVYIYALKRAVPLATLPHNDIEHVLDVLRDAKMNFIFSPSILDTAFLNMGALLHPTPTLMNVGWIESQRTEFRYYYEGVTRGVARLLEHLDTERVFCATKYGVKALTLVEWMAMCYATTGETVYDAIHGNEAYRDIDAPKTIEHRYLHEDVPTGLVPLESLALAAGAPHKAISLVIDMCSVLCNVDFRKCGRTLQSLGIAEHGLNGIIEIAGTGHHINPDVEQASGVPLKGT